MLDRLTRFCKPRILSTQSEEIQVKTSWYVGSEVLAYSTVEIRYRWMCSMTAIDSPIGKLSFVQPGAVARRCRLDAMCCMWLRASSAVFGPVMAVQAVSSASQASRVVVPGKSSASCSAAHTSF